MSEADEKALDQAFTDIAELTGRITELQFSKQFGSPQLDTRDEVAPIALDMKVRKNLAAHFGKIYDVAWARDSRHLVSAGQDSRLIVWDAWLGEPLTMVDLRSSFVLSCAFAPSQNFVASAGLDNVVSIYNSGVGDDAKEQKKRVKQTVKVLEHHTGYVSGLTWLGDSDDRLVSSSGDQTVVLWNVERGEPETVFEGHTMDVTDVCDLGDGRILTCSLDKTSRLWDPRMKKCVMMFTGHEADVNAVSALHGGTAFVSGGEDSTVRLFDVRAAAQLAVYSDPNLRSTITSVAASRSGRAIFASYDINENKDKNRDNLESHVRVWDSLKNCHTVAVLKEHKDQVSSVRISPDGAALATGSWDKGLKIWC